MAASPLTLNFRCQDVIGDYLGGGKGPSMLWKHVGLGG